MIDVALGPDGPLLIEVKPLVRSGLYANYPAAIAARTRPRGSPARSSATFLAMMTCAGDEVLRCMRVVPSSCRPRWTRYARPGKGDARS